MKLKRLSWAGIEASDGRWRVLVDPLEDAGPLQSFLGPPRVPLVPVRIDKQTWVLVTHLHPDHCDVKLLARLPSGHGLCHWPIAEALTGKGVHPTPTELWRSVPIGPFRVTPVPSHDWRGDDQVAWVIESEAQRVIHCGDTIWHGGWYEIGRRQGPLDVAFLPINGVIAQLDGFTATQVPATLTPEEAIEAAIVLKAARACAIHHTLFHNPPRYSEQAMAVERFLAAGRNRHIRAVAPADGEELGL